MFGFGSINTAKKVSKAAAKQVKALNVFSKARQDLIDANSEYRSAVEEDDKRIAEARARQADAMAGMADNDAIISKLDEFLPKGVK